MLCASRPVVSSHFFSTLISSYWCRLLHPNKRQLKLSDRPAAGWKWLIVLRSTKVPTQVCCIPASLHFFLFPTHKRIHRILKQSNSQVELWSNFIEYLRRRNIKWENLECTRQNVLHHKPPKCHTPCVHRLLSKYLHMLHSSFVISYYFKRLTENDKNIIKHASLCKTFSLSLIMWFLVD